MAALLKSNLHHKSVDGEIMFKKVKSKSVKQKENQTGDPALIYEEFLLYRYEKSHRNA